MTQYTEFRKGRYMRLKNQARQQMALISQSRMRRQGGKGTADQPFYVQILNR